MTRISHLTNSLRVYRALAENKADAECLPEPEEQFNMPLRILAKDLELGLSAKEREAGAAKRAAEKVYGSQVSASIGRLEEYALKLLRWTEATVSPASADTPQLSCSARSRERGQVLLALARSKVDLQSLQDHGANFQFADMRDARLSGIVFDRVNMSYAQMRGIELDGVVFTSVRLNGADLRGTSINDSYSHDVNVSDSLVSLRDVTASKEKSDKYGIRNLAGGARSIQEKFDGSNRELCRRLKNGIAALGLNTKYPLIEVQARSDGKYARVILSRAYDLDHDGTLLWQGAYEGYPTKVFLIRDNCEIED